MAFNFVSINFKKLYSTLVFTRLKCVNVFFFLKFTNDNTYIDSFADHNHVQISERQINQRKFDNTF